MQKEAPCTNRILLIMLFLDHSIVALEKQYIHGPASQCITHGIIM
jgi:hypothetical protein